MPPTSKQKTNRVVSVATSPKTAAKEKGSGAGSAARDEKSPWAAPRHPEDATITTSAAASDAPSTTIAAPRVYLALPHDLCGLIISSWLVPTVRKPLRGVKTFVFATMVQAGMLAYMVLAMWRADPPKSPCMTPALLQLLGIYIFMATMSVEFNSIRLLQVAMITTRLKIPGGPQLEVTSSGVQTSRRLVQGADTFVDVRPTSTRQRWLLALAPCIELLIELATLGVGSMYLLVSENIEELILNAVAVNFVTQIDEICLVAFVNKASRERMNKYLVEQKWGIEDGDTNLATASPLSKRIAVLSEYLPVVLLLAAASCVAGGQAYGRSSASDASDEGGPTCTWLDEDF